MTNKELFIDLLIREARLLTNFNYLVSYTLPTYDKEIDQQERWSKHINKIAKYIIIYYKLEQKVTNNIVDLPAIQESNFEAFIYLNRTLTTNNYSGFLYTFLKNSNDIKIFVYDNSQLIKSFRAKENSDIYKIVFDYRILFEKTLAPTRQRINTLQYRSLIRVINLLEKYLKEL